VLNGNPGEFATIARSHGDDWYLGSMTNWTPRTLDVPLSFLGPGTYTAEIYADGNDAATQPKHVEIRRQEVKRTQSLTLHLAPGGGCAIRFIPRKAH
jgi:alpha-glucosidase